MRAAGEAGAAEQGPRSTMSQPHNAIPVVPFDATRYLTNDTAITEYIAAVLETGNADLLRLALTDVNKARHKAEEGPA